MGLWVRQVQYRHCEPRTNRVHSGDRMRRGRLVPLVAGAWKPGHKDREHVTCCPASRRRIVHGQNEGPRCRALADRAQFRQGVDHAARQERPLDGHRNHLVGLARARHRARRRRPAARPGGRNFRPGILGQDHARAPYRRRGAEEGRHLRLHRRRARARPGLCPQARGRRRRSPDLAARHRRAGAGDRRHAGALRRDRRAGDRFGRGAGAARRARGRDGRRPARHAGPPDEPAAAQAHRLDLALQHHGGLHQPDPHEDRGDVRQPGDDERRQCAETLRFRAPRHPPHRRHQGARGGGREPDPRQSREEQARAAVQTGRVRHHVRRRHLQIRRDPRSRGQGRCGGEIRRLVLLRQPAHRPGPRERQGISQGQSGRHRKDRGGDPAERRIDRRTDSGGRRGRRRGGGRRLRFSISTDARRERERAARFTSPRRSGEKGSAAAPHSWTRQKPIAKTREPVGAARHSLRTGNSPFASRTREARPRAGFKDSMSGVNEIRSSFLDYFARHGHQVVPSSPLVPRNDPTLMFTNAGMVQFKNVFTGVEKRPYARAVTAQKCVRAGGKHNDLDNVGYTARHHTFFEMLGNFSFGDYFKDRAIELAWNLVTKEFGLPKDRLIATVYVDDDQAFGLWKKIAGLPDSRIIRIAGADNFWAMGDTGPCGPCSEIFYDHGAQIAGGPPGSPDEDGDRYVEIWNLVFMQYERSSDGVLVPLPKPSVDTGMGLERVAAVMQGVHSNYDIDLFKSLIRSAAEVTGTDDLESSSLRVIADHIRACTFLIVDGVVPSNEGRGYVLRRIIRRAIRHGHKLGQTQPFFHKLVATLVREMGSYYTELVSGEARATQVLAQEESRFAETLTTGMALLDAEAAKLTSSVIPGETVFRLYDTYGFPLDLTADVARERGLNIDQAGFDAAMEAQIGRSRAASKFGTDLRELVKLPGRTEFSGYDHVAGSGVVTSLIFDGALVGALRPGQEGQVVLDHTPFYAESGGQIGDAGVLVGAAARFTVRDTQKIGASFAHLGVLDAGELRVGDVVEAQVDSERRIAIALNHSATHLLHAALRKVLGLHVEQKGSLVAADRLRFDFSHTQALSIEELRRVEEL